MFPHIVIHHICEYDDDIPWICMPGLGARRRHGIIIQMRPSRSQRRRLQPPPLPHPCRGIIVPTMIMRWQCGQGYPWCCRSRMRSSINRKGGRQAWQGAGTTTATMTIIPLPRWPWGNTPNCGVQIRMEAGGTDWRYCWDRVRDSTPPCFGIYRRQGTDCTKVVGAMATGCMMVIKRSLL